MILSLDYISQTVNGEIVKGDGKGHIYSVTTDSRQLSPKSLFIALIGEKYNGHDFVFEALEKGASAAIISETIKNFKNIQKDRAVIRVDDTLQALQDLARGYREQFNIPVIAVTGSVGKTTTKDIIAACLSPFYNTLKTEGNLNNDIGLPLTILRLKGGYQAAVLELAMRGLGEIERLTRVSRPTCAVITNIEPVHLETMGSIENIALAKCEVLTELGADNFALIDGDNELLIETARNKNFACQLYTFGYQQNCDFQIKKVAVEKRGIKIDMRLMDKEDQFFFPVPSVKLATNVASALAVIHLLGFDTQKTKTPLAKFTPSGNRLNIIYLPEGGIIINDTYNANPISMAAALETSRALKSDGKLIAVLGDMFEMGYYEAAGHQEVGEKAFDSGVDILVAIGERARYIAKGATKAGMPPQNVYHFSSKPESLKLLKSISGKKDTVLFKASRGMEFETLVKEWLDNN